MIRKILVLLFALTIAASLASAQDIAGDWQGTLHAGSIDLRLVLHLTKASDGSYKGTLDSVDQGANGIPVNSVVLKDSKLNLGVDAVHGTYDAQVAADGKTITGTWMQNQPLPLEFTRATAPIKTEHKPAKPTDIDGTWSGTLDTGTTKIAGALPHHQYRRRFDGDDGQSGPGHERYASDFGTRDGSSLRIETRAIGGVYTGKIASTSNRSTASPSDRPSR